jgi:hypothetical protein
MRVIASGSRIIAGSVLRRSENGTALGFNGQSLRPKRRGLEQDIQMQGRLATA